MRGTNRIFYNWRVRASSLEAAVGHPGVPESVPQGCLKHTHHRLKPQEGRSVYSPIARAVLRVQGLLVAMLLMCQMLAAKDIEVSDSTYSYTKVESREKIRITEYTVRNMSDEPHLTWVNFSGRDETRKRKIFRYFHAPHGDMNLAMLMTDNVVREPEDIILGVSFIKVLKPHGSFKYVVVNEKVNKDFCKHIIVEKASTVAKIIGFQVPEAFSFAKDYFVVPQ